jgi:hypothetical protein
MQPKATLTNPSAALRAVRQGKQSATEAVAINRDGKPSRQYVRNVAKRLRYLLSLEVIDQSIAAIAIPSSVGVVGGSSGR